MNSETIPFWLTIGIFSATYLGLALGGIPGLRTDRTGIALAGAAAVIGCRLLSFDDAVKSVDFATIVLLLGMMIVVEFLRRADFFRILADRALTHVQSPRALLAVVMSLSGVLSALLVNDVVCLALTPLVLHIARQLNVNPKPQLIGLALASNVGSVATLTGNPQNMIIGGLSQISYLRFAAKLAPIAIVGLIVSYLLTVLLFRSELRGEQTDGNRPQAAEPNHSRPIHSKKKHLLIKSLVVTGVAVMLFSVGAPMEVVAIGAAGLLLIDRVRPEKIFRHVDWSLLVMFAGLFVVVHSFEVHVMKYVQIEQWSVIQSSPVAMLSLVSAVLSNIVSNVPAVLLFKQIVAGMPSQLHETAWLTLAMSSTFAGNFTILGSVANLIVVENAHKQGLVITLADYCRVGIPVTMLTILLGIGWLMFATY